MTDKELHDQNLKNIGEFVKYVKSEQAQKDIQHITRMFDRAIRFKAENYLLMGGEDVNE